MTQVPSLIWGNSSEIQVFNWFCGKWAGIGFLDGVKTPTIMPIEQFSPAVRKSSVFVR